MTWIIFLIQGRTILGLCLNLFCFCLVWPLHRACADMECKYGLGRRCALSLHIGCDSDLEKHSCWLFWRADPFYFWGRFLLLACQTNSFHCWSGSQSHRSNHWGWVWQSASVRGTRSFRCYWPIREPSGRDWLIEINSSWTCRWATSEVSGEGVRCSSPANPFSSPKEKGIIIREPTGTASEKNTPTSDKGKAPTISGSEPGAVSVRFPGDLMCLSSEQYEELFGHLGKEVDITSVAKFSLDQTHDILCGHAAKLVLSSATLFIIHRFMLYMYF